MSVRFGGPYPGVQTYVFLPNPQFGDSEGYTMTLSRRRSMDNTLYTYVKSKDGRKRLQMRFRMTRMKMLEFRAFLLAYYRTKIELLDHEDQLWIGWIMTNPNEFDNADYFASPNPALTGETYASIQIEFEGTKQ